MTAFVEWEDSISTSAFGEMDPGKSFYDLVQKLSRCFYVQHCMRIPSLWFLAQPGTTSVEAGLVLNTLPLEAAALNEKS